MKKITAILTVMFFLLLITKSFSQGHNLIVDVKKTMATIQPTMWGIFFEDINMAADGGIYAELVKNRSFEFFEPLMGWKILKPDTTTGIYIITQSDTRLANPRFVRLTVTPSESSFGLSNAGFRGIGLKAGMTYHFSVWARQMAESSVRMKIELVDSKDQIVGSSSLVPQSVEWEKFEVDIQSSLTDSNGRINVWFEGQGSIDLDMVSLFPDDTWKNRKGGLRADLVQLLADLKPGFIRFPGGCIVEGRELATRYQWKKTIGKVEDRKMIVNRWNTEFSHRLTPDYFQTFGLGFFEYFQLAEDLGAEPLPILSCGMACQFNTAELVPLNELDPYVQDALDLIEFANGGADSKWGKIRAQMGHPAPFNMKMIGVGNEQWGPQYIDRYKVFEKAIHVQYPEIKIVSGTGPSPDGKFFDMASSELKKLNAQIVDEHYYAQPDWFLKNATRYDNYDRNNYKIFAGEYAAQSVKTVSPKNQNNWQCAISEAAFMTGLERNADVVSMCLYAPLLAHVDGWQWTPDLIWFDNLKSFGTTNYYVQKMFSTNKGSQVLSVLEDNIPLAGQDGLYASAAFDQQTNEIILKLINSFALAQQTHITLENSGKLISRGKIILMKSDNLQAANSLSQPSLVIPVEQELTIKGKIISQSLAPYSFTLIRIKVASR